MAYIPPKMRAWIANQSARRAAIPHPSSTSPYVIYQRESTNSYWQSRREDGLDYIPDQSPIKFKVDEITTFISNVAQEERKKEERFLEQFYKGSNKLSHIEKFNALFQGKERYDEYNRRIQDILSRKQFEENKDQSRNQFYTGMAPNLSSVFTTYFNTHFIKLLQVEYEKLTPKQADSLSYIEKIVDETVRKAILAASDQMVYHMDPEKINEYGDGKEWAPILKMLQEDDNGKTPALDMFTDKLRQAIGETNLTQLAKSLQVKKHNPDNRRIRTIVKEDLQNISGRKASIGGSIVEIVAPMIFNALEGETTTEGGTIKRAVARSFGANTMMTDFAMLFTTNYSLDLELIMDELYKAMQVEDTTHIREVYKKLEQFYVDNNFNDEFEELYTVFVNAKNYGIGANGRNYVKKYEGSFEELPYFLQANGINIKSAQGFLNFAYNTGKDAVRAPYQSEFKAQCEAALAAVAANMMFDDYQMIGRGDNNAIHIYYLSGKYIPASEVYKSIIDTLQTSSPATWASVSLPNPIRDYGILGDKSITENWATALGMPRNQNGKVTDATFKEILWKHWQDEYDEAKLASRWSVAFSLRIKALVAKS